MVSRKSEQDPVVRPVAAEERGAESFPERLETLVEMVGNANLLAKKSEVPLSSLRHYLNGGEPTRPVLAALAKAAGVRVSWLVTGEGAVREDGVRQRPSEAEDVVWVPRYRVRASAGDGGEVGAENVRGMVAFPREWVLGQLGVTDPSRLCLIEVEGDSMEPTLRPGDMVLVDCSDVRPRDGIFALQLDGALYVKRLQVRDKHHLEVISDNQERYPQPRMLSADNIGESEDTRVVGRVIWATRRF